MRRLLIAVVVAFAFSGSAHAAVPNLDAKAFYVVNASNGEVLAAQQRARAAADRKHHEADDGDRRARPSEARRHGDGVGVRRAGRRVADPARPRPAHQRARPARRSVDPEREQCSGRARVGGVGRRLARVRRLDERARPQARPARHALRAAGRARRAGPRVERARRRAARAGRDALCPSCASSCASAATRSKAARFVTRTWNDLLGVFPGLIGVKTGHTNDAGWCEVAAARRAGFTIYAVILGSPTRAQRNFDLQRLLAWGVSQYRTLTLVAAQPYAWAAAPYGRRAVALVARRPLVRAVRVGRPDRRADRRADRRFAARDAGRAARPDRGLVRADAARHPAAARRQHDRAARGSADGYGGTARGPCTTCSGSSRDRHRHPQRRSRSHAHGAELPARPPSSGERQPDLGGRQGHQRRARAQAPRLAGDRDRPRRAARRATGSSTSSPARRSSTTSSASATSRARRSPSSIRPPERSTEIYEWGPAVRREELDTLLDKLHYLSRVATFVVFSGSLPRDVEDDFYAEAVRDLNRRGVQCVLDSEGEPLRHARRRGAVPRLAEPARGGEPRRPGVLRRRRLPDGARRDRRPRRAQRADHAGDVVLRPVPRGPHAASLPRVDRPRSSRSRRSVRATSCSPASSPRASTRSRSTRRCVRASAARPRRSSSSAPAGSTRARPRGSRRASSSKSCSRSRLDRRARGCARRSSGSRPRRGGCPRATSPIGSRGCVRERCARCAVAMSTARIERPTR